MHPKLLAAAALAAAGTATVVLAGHSPTPTAEPPVMQVTWSPGPWGPLELAGQPVIIPASGADGPLADRGDGWASDYAPTAVGAAVATLRNGLFAAAAPAQLRAEVLAATFSPDMAARVAATGPANPGSSWAFPSAMVEALEQTGSRTLGAVSELGGSQAVVSVYTTTAGPDGDVVMATDFELTYQDRQWLIAGQDPAREAVAPPAYTVAVPSQ